MNKVAFDTNVIIYWLEDNPLYAGAARRILTPVVEQSVDAAISVTLCTEFIAGTGAADALEPLFLLGNLSVIDVSFKIAKLAGEISSTYKLSPLDSIHLATALDFGATKFYTNDKQLIKIKTIGALEISSLI